MAENTDAHECTAATSSTWSSPPPPSLTRSISVHAIIKPPVYVRTQTLGLQRARTVSSANTSSPPPISVPLGAPNKPRSSVAFPGTATSGSPEKGVQAQKPLQRPLKHRSQSLPSFECPPPGLQKKEQHSLLYEYGETCDVAELPTDPRAWTPSQLSIYLAHVLKLTPRPLINDVMRFVVKSGLTGKRFLRLRDEDLVTFGINVSWCRIFSKARERLRTESLRGRLFGTVSSEPSPTESPAEANLMSLFLHVPSKGEEGASDDWKKNSWRRTEGKKSRGRVKGIAKAFEEPKEEESLSSKEARNGELEEVQRIRRSRSRQTSSGSFVSDSSEDDLDVLGNPASKQTSTHERRDSECSARSESTLAEDDTAGGGGAKTPAAITFNWGLVEPISLEEAQDLPSGSVSSHDTIFAPTPAAEKMAFIGEEDEASASPTRIRGGDDLEQQPSTTAKYANLYQSRIRTHGEAAYSAIRKSARRPSSPSALADSLDSSPEEHLADWVSSQALFAPDVSSTGGKKFGGLPASTSLPSIYCDFEQDDPPIPIVYEPEDGASKSPLAFAENEGLVETMKKQQPSQPSFKSLRARSHSVENFDSIKFTSVRSVGRSAQKLKQNDLRDLFDGDPARTNSAHEVDNEEDELLQMKSRDGTMVVISKKQFDEMQTRLSSMEAQLAAASSRGASRYTYTDSSTSSTGHEMQSVTKREVMSEWAKTALGEAGGLALHPRDQSWIGMGGWALAAGLGIGIVLGEAVIGKLRR